MAASTVDLESQFLLAKHKKYLKSSLDVLPEGYSSLDTSRLTLLFFVLSGLDLLDALNEISNDRKHQIVEWIYSLQMRPPCGNIDDPVFCGFRGSLSSSGANNVSCHKYDTGHIAMTYTGIACLLILGDDLKRLDVPAILAELRACQVHNGSFTCIPQRSESDMRFVYCAVAISFLLGDWSGIELPSILTFVKESINIVGFGIGQGPSSESHGGSTFCAIATLSLADRLFGPSALLDSRQRERIKRWCVLRQDEGFHGRVNKPDDSCYTFWIGASLQMLNGLDLVDHERLMQFTLSTQDEVVGGFGKYVDQHSDLLHTYLSIAGLSLLGLPGLQTLHPALNISQRAYRHLQSLKSNSEKLR